MRTRWGPRNVAGKGPDVWRGPRISRGLGAEGSAVQGITSWGVYNQREGGGVRISEAVNKGAYFALMPYQVQSGADRL